MTTNIGTIELGDKICITDPIYNDSRTIAFKPGKYSCFVDSDEQRCGTITSLFILHEDRAAIAKEVSYEGYVWVDSGQAGIFDADYFRSKQDEQINAEWNEQINAITLAGTNCGVIDGKGVITCSGYGDGCYDVFSATDERGLVDFIFINFMK